jgi:hypothetical protein
MATKSRQKPRPVAAKPAIAESVVSSSSSTRAASKSQPLIVDRAEVEAAIIQHIETAEMRPIRRRRLSAIFNDGRRPALKENIVDNVLHEIEQNGDLEELPEGVLAARDWAAFFEVVMKYLPMILKLFGL